jgi:hypothetical protein
VNRYLTELVILDARYSAAALTAALRGCPSGRKGIAQLGHYVALGLAGYGQGLPKG